MNDSFIFYVQKIDGKYPDLNKILRYSDKKIEFNIDHLVKLESDLKLIDDNKLFFQDNKIICKDEDVIFEDDFITDIDIILDKKLVIDCLKNVNFESDYMVYSNQDNKHIKIEDNNNALLVLSIQK